MLARVWGPSGPAFLLTTAHPFRQDEQLATLRGAVAYLSKPISATQLLVFDGLSEADDRALGDFVVARGPETPGGDQP